EILLKHTKTFAYTWFNLQAQKRKYFKKFDKKISLNDEEQSKLELQSEAKSVQDKWLLGLIGKILKDIQSEDRADLVRCISSGGQYGGCIRSQPDHQGRMRRIDCLRQSDKIWRLDLVMVILFRAVPLENTDGERVVRTSTCKRALCINPHHILVECRELDLFIALRLPMPLS
ncbi:hypothetical protein HELRODRAFT_80234, partial [Helobdella robusta]|uniref:CTF/NF-I domain-containing protein n=1 Tax=Helobdella robusta TaxID=6412 RepID=T1G3Y8_HELRO